MNTNVVASGRVSFSDIDFQIAKYLRNVLLLTAGRILFSNVKGRDALRRFDDREGWTDEFCMDELVISVKKAKATLLEEFGVNAFNPNALTEAQLKELGFKPWAETENSIHYLIPLYLFGFIQNGVELVRVNDTAALAIHDLKPIDPSKRESCVAYGVIITRPVPLGTY